MIGACCKESVSWALSQQQPPSFPSKGDWLKGQSGSCGFASHKTKPRRELGYNQQKAALAWVCLGQDLLHTGSALQAVAVIPIAFHLEPLTVGAGVLLQAKQLLSHCAVNLGSCLPLQQVPLGSPATECWRRQAGSSTPGVHHIS